MHSLSPALNENVCWAALPDRFTSAIEPLDRRPWAFRSRYERYGEEQISRLCRKAKSDTSVIQPAI